MRRRTWLAAAAAALGLGGPMAFRFTGGSCCCCVSFFVRGQASLNLLAYRSVGEYPNNTVQRVGFANAEGSSTVRAFCVDWRNQLVFHTGPNTSQTRKLFKNNMLLQQQELIGYYDAPISPRREVGGMACDWQARKLYYSTLQSTDGGVPVENRVYQIRRVNYDGSGDEEFLTQTWETPDTIPNSAPQRRLRIVPEWNAIFWWVTSRRNFSTTALPNIQLYRADLTGGAPTLVYDQTDPVFVGGDSFQLQGFDVAVSDQKLIWGEYVTNSVDRRQFTYLAELDASSPVTLLSSTFPLTGSSENEYAYCFSEKTRHIYYCGFRANNVPSNNRRFTLKRTHIDDAPDLTGNSHAVIADGVQAVGLVSGGTVAVDEMMIGCQLESTGKDFRGAT